MSFNQTIRIGCYYTMRKKTVLMSAVLVVLVLFSGYIGYRYMPSSVSFGPVKRSVLSTLSVIPFLPTFNVQISTANHVVGTSNRDLKASSVTDNKTISVKKKKPKPKPKVKALACGGAFS